MIPHPRRISHHVRTASALGAKLRLLIRRRWSPATMLSRVKGNTLIQASPSAVMHSVPSDQLNGLCGCCLSLKVWSWAGSPRDRVWLPDTFQSDESGRVKGLCKVWDKPLFYFAPNLFVRKTFLYLVFFLSSCLYKVSVGVSRKNFVSPKYQLSQKFH